MPHIALPEGYPGITSGFMFRPETAKPMRELAHVLLHGPNTLTPAEREALIKACDDEGTKKTLHHLLTREITHAAMFMKALDQL